jgi:hypothetical protein
VQSIIYGQQATASLAAYACRLAAESGLAELSAALQSEVAAGALTCQYPPGLTTRVAGTPLEHQKQREAVAPISASGIAVGVVPPGGDMSATEPDIAVFRTHFAELTPREPAAASNAPTASYDELKDVCEIVDALLQRVRFFRDVSQPHF